MATEREILERAAKAAGLALLEWQDGMQTGFLLKSEPRLWNPFTDEGDRYRLAKTLKLRIDFEAQAVIGYTPDDKEIRIHWGDDGWQEYKTDAQAIVLAAAHLAPKKEQTP